MTFYNGISSRQRPKSAQVARVPLHQLPRHCVSEAAELFHEAGPVALVAKLEDPVLRRTLRRQGVDAGDLVAIAVAAEKARAFGKTKTSNSGHNLIGSTEHAQVLLAQALWEAEHAPPDGRRTFYDCASPVRARSSTGRVRSAPGLRETQPQSAREYWVHQHLRSIHPSDLFERQQLAAERGELELLRTWPDSGTLEDDKLAFQAETVTSNMARQTDASSFRACLREEASRAQSATSRWASNAQVRAEARRKIAIRERAAGPVQTRFRDVRAKTHWQAARLEHIQWLERCAQQEKLNQPPARAPPFL